MHISYSSFLNLDSFEIYSLIVHSLRVTNLTQMENTYAGGFLNLLGYQLNGYTTHGMHLNLYFKLLVLSWDQIILSLL